MVAPTSSTTISVRSVGQIAAMAGREIPSIGRRQKVAIAISAPVLPPDTATSASPSLTDCSAAHIDELPLPLRSAWEGFSSIEMTLSQCTILECGFSSAIFVEQRREFGFPAMENEADIAPFTERQQSTVNRHLRADIAAHGVDGNAYRI